MLALLSPPPSALPSLSHSFLFLQDSLSLSLPLFRSFFLSSSFATTLSFSLILTNTLITRSVAPFQRYCSFHNEHLWFKSTRLNTTGIFSCHNPLSCVIFFTLCGVYVKANVYTIVALSVIEKSASLVLRNHVPRQPLDGAANSKIFGSWARPKKGRLQDQEACKHTEI